MRLKIVLIEEVSFQRSQKTIPSMHEFAMKSHGIDDARKPEVK